MVPKHSETVQSALERRLAFEITVSKISSRFVMLSNDLTQSIQDALEDMGKITGASRAYIFQFRDDLARMDNSHEWCSVFAQPEIDNLQDLPTNMFPWWMSKLKCNDIILIPDVSKLPADAASEKEILEAQDIKALIVLPINVNDILFGYIGLDNVEEGHLWKEDDLVLLRLTSEIFGSAFQRLEYETQLRDRNNVLSGQLEEIKKLQSQLIQQEKMVGIGQLAAGIAHEINNPLGFVSSNYEMLYRYTQRIQKIISPIKLLLDELDHSPELSKVNSLCLETRQLWKQYKLDSALEEMTDLLEDSKIGFDRVSQIVSSLRNFAHIDHSNAFEHENIHHIIDEVLIILTNELKYYTEVDCQYGDILLVNCHRGQLGQVFINLIMNAIHAIRNCKRDTLGKIIIKTWQEKGSVCISINDNGTGIEPHLIDQIFNPFFTTKDVGEGTGLGLSISYDLIVNKHSGTLEVNSFPNIGTTFTIQLPLRNA
jgi:signal transduction histidine kinase